jgi:polysaccharide pyruvyl transferase WcaK-like protein
MVVAELNTTSGIFAREDVTAGYLAGLGVDTPVIRMSDPAFLMPARAVKDANLQPRLDGAIGVNLSPLIGEKQRKTPAQWVEDCAAIVTSLVNKFDRPIILVPHVTVPGSDDRALMSGVLARLDEKTLDVTQLLPDGLDALETKWMIGQMAAFVGARTHATIAAMSQGVPTVSVGYSAKAVGINLDVLGHDRFVIGLDELSVDALNGRVDMLLRESDSVSETLRAALPEVQARARSGFEQLLSILDSPNGGMIRDA